MTIDLLAPRMRLVRPSPTAAISDKIRALLARGEDVINLGEGELSFDTPAHIKRAGIAAIEAGETKYTAVAGTAELKAAIIDKFATDNAIRYAPEEVIAGTGAKQLIFNALLATVGAGDEVLVCAPYWVSYPDMVALAEGRTTILRCDAAAGWKLQPAALRRAIGPKTRWLILNSPNNPTGAIYSRDALRALADVLLEHPHVLLLADDIYEYVRHGQAFATPAEVEPRLKERTLTVNGLSKAYSMTGWRIGFAGGPAWLIAAMLTLQSQSTSNPSSISQAAAIAALKGGTAFMGGWLDELAAGRDLVLATIGRCPGLRCPMPEGAFYAFVDCRGMMGATTPAGRIIGSDLDFADYLLEAAHIGVVHGAAFGMDGHIRIAYAVEPTVLREACRRIETACRALVLPHAG